MHKTGRDKVLLIEDHHEAYYAWKKRNLKNLPLIHLDAHIDFGFQEVKDARLAVEEAKSLSDLKAQLEKAMLFRQKQLSLEKLTHIGNYIYPAMRDGIVKEFFWVIPGDRKEFKRCLKIIKSTLKILNKQDPKPATPVKTKDGLWQTTLYGRRFCIGCLETLPKINQKTLLDIDTDFLVIDSLRRANAFDRIAKRKPWITPGALARLLKNKIPRPKFTTIAYSVNGGFTPMIYKTLGDDLARHLGHRDPRFKNRLAAGEHFRTFRQALDKKNLVKAAFDFQKAVKLNPAYRAADSHYGMLYLQKKNYAKAAREFGAMLNIDPIDGHNWAGLGRIHLISNRLKPAEKYFQKALALSKDNKHAVLGLAETKFRLKDLQKAKRLLRRYEKLAPLQGYPRYLLGRIYEKEGQPLFALKKYQEALQLGQINIELLTRLVKLSLRWDKDQLPFLKTRLLALKKASYRRKMKGAAEIKRLERIFRNHGV